MKWLYVVIPVFILGIILMVHASNTGDDPDRNGTGENYDYTDRDAPKTIASKDISSFAYSFPTYDLNQWQGRNIPYDLCTFSLVREAEGARCTGSGGGNADYFAFFQFEFFVPLSALDDLQTIIDKHELAKVNGVVRGSIGIPEDNASHLSVEYTSKESLYASDNTGPILDSEASAALYDFFLTLAQAADSDFMYSDEEFWALHDKLWGRFESADGKTALVFKDFSVEIYEGDEHLEYAPYYIQADSLYRSFGGSFALYTHFAWHDGVLIGIAGDGTETEFFAIAP